MNTRRWALVLAMLAEHRFHTREILAQPVRFAQRLLVIVGDRCEKRRDFHFVEAAKGRPERLLAEVEGTDIHAQFCSGWLIGVSQILQ